MIICRLCINLKKVKFELRIRKKKTFQYRYYILPLENITLSCLSSSSRVSNNGIAANYVLFKFSRTTQDLDAMGLCRYVSRTYGVYVNFSDIASTVNVLTISNLYSDIQIPIQHYTSYNMRLLKQTWRFKCFLHAQGFGLCSSFKEMCVSIKETLPQIRKRPYKRNTSHYTLK